jgi:hypothetical protein
MTWQACARCCNSPCTCRWPYHVTQPAPFVPYPVSLKFSDEDVERIAKRVAELLKETP